MIIWVHGDRTGMMLKVAGDQKIAKKRVHVEEMIGHPYGSRFEIQGKKLIRIEESKFSLENTLDDPSVTIGGSGDNSNYEDSNTAQKLTQGEIEEMKMNGTSGVDILRSLVKNSETWGSKTSFAQEKWLRRKSKKYVSTFRVEKSTPATLCSVFFDKSPAKICHLRWDVLAQMISHSNVKAGCRVLVIDSLIGLLTATVAYRMRGMGTILSMYCGQQPHIEMIEWLNLLPSEYANILPVSSTELGPAADYVQENGLLSSILAPSGKCSSSSNNNCSDRLLDGMISTADEDTGEIDDERDDMEPKSSSEHDNKFTSGEIRRCNYIAKTPEEKLYVTNALRSGASRFFILFLKYCFRWLCSFMCMYGCIISLIIGTKYHPLPLLKEALNLLALSSSIVIYCEYMEPLTECFNYLVKYQLAVRVTISDTWMREFQTLPGRLHPNMHMPTSGGYYLSGIFVGLLSQVKAANEREETKVYSTAVAYPVGGKKSRENGGNDSSNDYNNSEDDGEDCNSKHLTKKQKNL